MVHVRAKPALPGHGRSRHTAEDAEHQSRHAEIKSPSAGTVEAAIDRNKEYHKNHVACVIDAFDTPYVEGYTALRDLHKKMEEDVKNDPDLILTELLEPAVHKVFSLSIRFKTRGNAIRAAVRLYLIKAQTGKLPNKLPAGLPKDLFSGKDFEYKKTADGFILRCQGKDLGKGQNNEYEFKVKK